MTNRLAQPDPGRSDERPEESPAGPLTKGGEVIGSDIAGFRLESEISGGETPIYLGRHRRLGRVAAIEVLPGSAGAEAIDRFLDRVARLTELRHPGTITVLASGRTADGSGYAVTEMIEGESLASRLRRKGRLPPVVAVRLGRQLAETLDVCHDASLVHGAVTAERIILVADRTVDGSERPRLRDFGAACLTGRPAAAGDVSDLGTLLFQVLCGQRPFEHNGQPARVSDLGGPIELDRILAATLAPDPARRPTMAAVARALGAAEPPSPLPPPPPPPEPLPTPVSSPPPPRGSTRWLIGGTIALAIGVAAAVALSCTAL